MHRRSFLALTGASATVAAAPVTAVALTIASSPTEPTEPAIDTVAREALTTYLDSFQFGNSPIAMVVAAGEARAMLRDAEHQA